MAWLFRVRTLAEKQVVPAYSVEKLAAAVESRKTSSASAGRGATHRILAEAGVRLVFAACPGSKIDGATFWLDDGKPVIGMTIRFDRIDNFGQARTRGSSTSSAGSRPTQTCS